MQPMWMSPERKISPRAGPLARGSLRRACAGLPEQVDLLGPRELVRPLVARLVDVGDHEGAEVDRRPGQARDTRAHGREHEVVDVLRPPTG